MTQKAFGYDPIGSSQVAPLATNTGKCNDEYSVKEFSGSGSGNQADNGNQADSYSAPHPLTPAHGPGYDKDNYQAKPLVGEILAPEYERGFEYGEDRNDSETSPQQTPSVSGSDR